MSHRPRLNIEEAKLFEFVEQRDLILESDPRSLIPILFRPCRVRVLMVTDGGLDFGSSNFGLRTFVETLLGGAGFYARFDITLAHIDARSGDAMMDPDDRINNRITNFRFDNSDHFQPDMYDQVWLFGIRSAYPNRDPNDASVTTLAPAEIDAITTFMNQGGGVFATGDHASLGRALSSAVPRAGSMRLWDSTAPPDEVSMGGSRRNDTNRIGHDAGTQFNDQSDDIPQTIQPKLYKRFGPFAWMRTVFPHPLLCGPNGVIRVMPDHPHEGECVEPAAPTPQEYPDSTDGSPRPLPDVISTSSVPAGNNSDGTKQATEPHTFGGICAYDGHRAEIGRVVTDATWHHFVNINLVGDTFAGGAKRIGFLASSAGRDHLAEIRTYYRNIAVWISRDHQIRCMRNHILWHIIWGDRVLEAVATRDNLRFADVDLPFFYDLGRHARDVLDRYAGRCQSYELIIDWLKPRLDFELLRTLNPWWPTPEPGPDPVPWFNLEPLLDAALGGAIVAIREKYSDAAGEALEVSEDQVAEIATAGASRTLELALDEARRSCRTVDDLLAGSHPKDGPKQEG